MLATVLTGEEKSIFLVSAAGHVLHFPIEEINILSGVGKGVIGIKLEEDDTCLGGRLVTKSHDAIEVETTGGKVMDFTGRHEVVSRGGKGFEAVKRSSFARIVPPPIALVDWDQMEGKNGHKNGNGEKRNGDATLFD